MGQHGVDLAAIGNQVGTGLVDRVGAGGRALQELLELADLTEGGLPPARMNLQPV